MPGSPRLLTLAEHRPGQRLRLESDRGPRRRLMLRAWHAIRPPARRRDQPLAIDRLQCDADSGTLQLAEAATWRSRPRSADVEAGELDRLRLRAADPADGPRTIVMSATLTSGQPPVTAVFRVAELDRDDEVVDLAIRIGRCLGLGGYSVRSRNPADVELAPSAELDPFRTAHIWHPVPPDGGPIDYSAQPAERPEVSATRSQAPGDALRLGEQWRVERWEPGRAIELSRPGNGGPWRRLLRALLSAPLHLLQGLLYAAILLAFALVVFAIFTVPPLLVVDLFVSESMISGYPSVLFAIGKVMAYTAAAGAGLLAIGNVAATYEAVLPCSRLLDWDAGEYIERAGSRRTIALPLAAVQGATCRDLGSGGIAIVLETVGEDRELCRWRAPTDGQAAEIEALVAAIDAELA